MKNVWHHSIFSFFGMKTDFSKGIDTSSKILVYVAEQNTEIYAVLHMCIRGNLHV